MCNKVAFCACQQWGIILRLDPRTLILVFCHLAKLFWFASLSTLSVPDEGYCRNVPDEGYCRNVPDEGYYRNVPDEGYYRYASCALNLIFTLLLDN